ncbi:MAG TPA: hypothetical protein VKS21_05755 [Spirochaetota bacterium]|nr:hypothetical protein [Spirochaetota bacterium]
MKYIFLFVLISLSFSFSSSISLNEKKLIIKVTENFLKALTSSNVNSIRKLTADDIDIKYYTPAQVQQHIDLLIANKINALQYLHFITGINIYKCINKFKHKKWTIVSAKWNKNNIYQDRFSLPTANEQVKIKTYNFIKIKLQIKETRFSSGGSSKNETQTYNAEIDIIKENKHYKILGFIL